jgi:hypothetical protein
MRRLELIFLHSASADGCNARHVLDEIPEQGDAINGTWILLASAYFVVDDRGSMRLIGTVLKPVIAKDVHGMGKIDEIPALVSLQ